MAIIPHLIARYALVLYAFSALGAFFYAWTAFQARRKEGLALFTMEREHAIRQGLRSWRMAGVCVLLALGVYGVSNYIAPNLPLDQADEISVIAILVTPTVSPTPSPTLTPVLQTTTLAPLPTVGPIPTPLERPPDTPTPPPTVAGDEAAMPAACTSAGTQITYPGNGDHLAGVVEVRGTASLPDFSFYKFEIQWPDSDEWVTLQSFEVPVAGGLLGPWDTTTLAPGLYKFRLVVVDNTSNFPEPCVINVVIEPPTPQS
jgi:hypothetical protein